MIALTLCHSASWSVLAYAFLVGFCFSVFTEAAVAKTCIGDGQEEVSYLQHDFIMHAHMGGYVTPTEARLRQHPAREAPHPVQKDASTTPDPTGMTFNAAGDMRVFMTAIATNILVVLVCLSFFMYARLRYPIMYSHNVLLGLAPTKPADTYFSWVGASLGVTIDDAIQCIGMDNALLLEYTHLCMKIMAVIASPMVCIMGPMNWAFGGQVAGEDHLSCFSFGNVENGSWLYWIHSIVVWYVVVVVKKNVYWAQENFLHLRYAWMKRMPAIRANTILVEGIPEDYASDQKLAEFFNNIMPGVDCVKKAYVAKDTSRLRRLVHKLNRAEEALRVAEGMWESTGRSPEDRPMIRPLTIWRRVDSIDYYTHMIEDLMPKVQAERARLRSEAARGPGGVNLTNGFVTFNDPVMAEIALRLDGISKDLEEWVISNPPEPMDIQWKDFTQEPTAEYIWTFLGYSLVTALYFGYLPLVIGISNLAQSVDVGVRQFQPLWAGFAPTLGLHIMVVFLPTFLINIFELCFTLKAAAFAQRELQIYYFWFQVSFVLLAAAVGQNINEFLKTLVAEPLSSFGVLADTMPYATHFYMNYMLLQWSTHAMVITRYAPLLKFFLYCRFFSEEDSKKRSEPEDQNYFGIGSRSARWTITMAIGIVFGTLSPPVSMLCLATFAFLRLVYGYLLVFAETRKPDLGGVFWVSQLRHLFTANVIYGILMTGVFMRRASSWGPAAISASTIIYSLWSQRRLDTAFLWQRVPFMELQDDVTLLKQGKLQVKLEGEYVQPEMVG